MSTNNSREFSKSTGIKKLESGNYEISTLFFNVKQLRLYDSKGEEIELDYQQAYLLKMFLEAEEYFLKKDEAILELWKDAKKAAYLSAYYNRFNMCITRLRDAFRADKDIELLCKTKKGYELVVKSKTSGE